MTDLPGQLAEAFATWLRSVAIDALGPTIDTATQLLFRTPPLDTLPGVGQAWAVTRDLADGLFVAAFTLVGLLVMVAGGYDARYTAKRLVPRVAVAAILTNGSLAICGVLITAANVMADGLVGASAGRTLANQIVSLVGQDAVAPQLFGVLTVLAAITAALLLVVVAVGRDLLLIVLTALAPLFLAAGALPQGQDLARLWWRVISALLFIQLVQAALVAVAVALVPSTEWLGMPGSTLIGGIAFVALLLVLVRLPFVAYRWAIERPSADAPFIGGTVAAARALVD